MKKLDFISKTPITKTVENAQIIATQWVLFCFNYSPYFITQVWGGGSMVQHFETKWSEANKRTTCGTDAMNHFYINLSNNNRRILMAYVLEQDF